MPQILSTVCRVVGYSTAAAKFFLLLFLFFLRIIFAVARFCTRSNTAFQVAATVGLFLWFFPKLIAFCGSNFKCVDLDGYP